MRAYLTLVRREVGSTFASLTGYVIISAVVFLIGFSFVQLLEELNREATDMPITELFYQTYYFWLILLLASPVITMRTFALEKASGTYETLTTTPISDLQIVLAKFTGALLFHLFIWLPLLACILIVRHYADDHSVFSVGMVFSTYLGIVLVGALYLSMGCFASALTRSQIIAVMISFVFGIAFFILSYRSLFSVAPTSRLGSALSYVSMIEHMQEFVRGVLDTRHVVFYLSLITFFLFLTHKVVESRRWK
jgi:ABC-2 type transport system permease protein